MERAYASLLQEYLSYFPCVAVLGPRQCGKTTLLHTLGDNWQFFDLERMSDHQVVARDPDLFFRLHPQHIGIDEAQLLPELFSALRVAIDQEREQTGRFVITGSSSPALLRAVSESLAGRIGIIEMAPFSFAETNGHLYHPFCDLLAARAQAANFADQLTPRGDLAQAHDYWFHGGYPEPWLKKTKRFHSVWMDQYIRTYIYRDIAQLFPRLDATRFQLFVQFLANLSGTIINYSEVSRALGVSQPTVRDYFEIAHGTFLWRRLPAYEKDATKRVVKHAKGHLRDSGLLHHLLRLPDLNALLSHPAMGRSWEGMIVEEIIRALSAAGLSFDAYHYRTGGGAEIDLVLEGEFGLVPIEIKYAQAITNRDLRSLRDFVAERNCPIGLIINNDEAVRQYDEKLVGVPFLCL
jgi:uncharacterized protein